MTTPHRPHGRYPFCVTITDEVLGQQIIIDFECEVEIEAEISAGTVDAECRDVFVNGKSLRDGCALTRELRTTVMIMADDEIRNGGRLWDLVREDEGFEFVGPAGSPDAHWRAGA